MAEEIDHTHYQRADTFIDLANEHAAKVARDEVSASFMYSSARFNAWISATNCASSAGMRDAKQERITYYVDQYRAMLEENMESYITNFDEYMKPNA